MFRPKRDMFSERGTSTVYAGSLSPSDGYELTIGEAETIAVTLRPK